MFAYPIAPNWHVEVTSYDGVVWGVACILGIVGSPGTPGVPWHAMPISGALLKTIWLENWLVTMSAWALVPDRSPLVGFLGISSQGTRVMCKVQYLKTGSRTEWFPTRVSLPAGAQHWACTRADSLHLLTNPIASSAWPVSALLCRFPCHPISCLSLCSRKSIEQFSPFDFTI